jgi:hypothetical protein
MYPLEERLKTNLKSSRDQAMTYKTRYNNLWEWVRKFCRIDEGHANISPIPSQGMLGALNDLAVNDDTAISCIREATSSTMGTLIGDGNFFKLKIYPEYENDKTLLSILEDFERQALRTLNRTDSNFFQSLQEVVRDYYSFGTSSLGIFTNQRGQFFFKSFGIQNYAISENGQGQVDNIYVDYQMSYAAIVNRWCFMEGMFVQDLFDLLPKKIRDNYLHNQAKDNPVAITYILKENPEFNIEAQDGRYSARYIGYWIDFDDNFCFEEEYFTDNPLFTIRANKQRDEIYGRGIAVNNITTIVTLNYMVGDVMEALEKIVKPGYAVYDNVVDDDEFDISPNSLNIIRTNGSGTGQQPFFPITITGDPSALLQYGVTELKERLNRAFGIDIFLDFNSKSQMTATETNARYNIRSKALYGMLIDFVKNILNPLINRLVVLQVKEALKDPELPNELTEEQYNWLVKIAIGDQQYNIEYASEVYQMQRSSQIENLFQFLNGVGMLAQYDPLVISTLDTLQIMYKLGSHYNYIDLVKDASAYQEAQQAQQEAQQQQAQMEQMALQSQAAKNNAGAFMDAMNGFRGGNAQR